MLEQVEARFTDILRPLFPKEAEFRFLNPKSDDLSWSIKWRLNNDPDRPSKRSRPIILVLSQDVLEDYNDSDNHKRADLEKIITKKVAECLDTFEPNHDAPYGLPVPGERWVLIYDRRRNIVVNREAAQLP